ncbi:MAG: putative serine/threonine protein kinase [Nocardia sp.]|uniref:serine/threonine-protein kinase n=1 Tax=Nocardia sp. TaxID=1821 RepID=UPI00262BC32E|nr:serine/threonine-protein kinase [Nocardia sp.]MCU1643015.1 putative serine/threonine protein kinase [Nocardia sp.]
MSDIEQPGTERDLSLDIAADLEIEGFSDAVEIGHGGFGVVYRCAQPELERAVAVKVMSADVGLEDRERFIREGRAMGRLSGHPNIVQVLQIGTTALNRPYIVMPFYERRSLADLVGRDGPLPWPEVRAIGIKIAGALESAHRSGIVHRDVKPANILLSDYDEPQLTDFGIARFGGAFETSSGDIAGSPAYTAPEVLQGDSPGPAADVYGLAATLFCLLTGHAAFERRSGERIVAQFLRITTAPIPDLRAEGIPQGISAAIEHGMARDPAARPQTAAEFRDELEAIEVGSRSAETPLPRPAVVLPAVSIRARTPPGVSTRFRPPTPAHSLVGRRRLLEWLWGGSPRRLVVIHAPAGFGKTTLAAQCRAALSDQGIPVAWLHVDRDDNNVAWFLSNILNAFRHIRPTLVTDLGQVLEEHGQDAARYVLGELINRIHDAGATVALVVDDWHQVSAEGTITAMDFLIENGCHHIRVIVTSRTQSGLPLSSMRVRDELVEICADDLRFTDSEAREFLVDINDLGLDGAGITALTSSTEGWIAALQLASLSLRRREDAAAFIKQLSGRHHAIGEYLMANVVDNLEPALLDFMMVTSITEQICGSLAGRLAGGSSPQLLLEEIERRDLFLQSIDDDREWFRYHHLFAQFLQRRLETDCPDRALELHLTASAWFAEHDMLSEAVDHALAGSDPERAMELVEADGMELVENSKMSTLLGLIAKLPLALVRTRPRMQLLVAWGNVLLHHHSATEAALEQVDSSLDDEVLSDGDRSDLRMEADFVRGVDRVFADRIDGVDELISGCRSASDIVRPFLGSAVAGIASFVAVHSFDFDAVQRWQAWASTYHAQTAGPFSVMYNYCMAGIASHEQLEVARAEGQLRDALRLGRESGPHGYAARLAGALLGALLYEKGAVGEAEQLLDESTQLADEGGIVDMMLATYGIGSRIKAFRGQIDDARHRLEQGMQIAEALTLPRLAARIVNEKVRIGLPLTESQLARLPAVPGGPRLGNGIEEVTAQLDEDSVIRVLLAEGTPESLRSAVIRAAALVERVERQGRPRALVECAVLHANCLGAAGDVSTAKDVLLPVLSRCVEIGLPRLVLDGGPSIDGILTAVLEALKSGDDAASLSNLTASSIDDLLHA